MSLYSCQELQFLILGESLRQGDITENLIVSKAMKPQPLGSGVTLCERCLPIKTNSSQHIPQSLASPLQSALASEVQCCLVSHSEAVAVTLCGVS